MAERHLGSQNQRRDLPTGFDLTEKVIVNRLLNFAEQIVWKDCPSNRRDLVHVDLFQNGKRIVYAAALVSRTVSVLISLTSQEGGIT